MSRGNHDPHWDDDDNYDQYHGDEEEHEQETSLNRSQEQEHLQVQNTHASNVHYHRPPPSYASVSFRKKKAKCAMNVNKLHCF